MTRRNAAQKMRELAAEKIVADIIEILSSENYEDAKAILEIVSCYIAPCALIDSELAKQILNEE